MAKALVVLLAALIVAFGAFSGAGAQTQTMPQGCGWVPNGSSGNPDAHALVCNGGTLRGWVNFEGGRYIKGRPKQLNINISGGSATHRGYVVLSPDNGKGTILEDGHLHKLALFRGPQHGGTQFRVKPTFKNGLIVCRSGKACIDLTTVLDELRQLRQIVAEKR